MTEGVNGAAGASKAPDVVVVGGGVVGCFTAYLLARQGVSVTVVERDEIAAHASRTNPGGLNPLHGAGIPGPLQAIAWESFELHLEHWDAVGELSGIDFSPERATRIQLAADESDLAVLELAFALHDAAEGFHAAWLGPEEVRRNEPRAAPDMIRGLLTEGSGRVDALAYTRALAAAARKHGAKFVTGRAVGVERDADHATRVVLEDHSLPCGVVVFATGPWAEAPARWLGVALPVEPVRGELLFCALDGLGLRHDITWRGAAVYPCGTTHVWLGGTLERAGYDASPSAAGRAEILEGIHRMAPGFGQLRVLGHIAALRPVSPDGLPVVGPAPGWDNVFVALGAGRKGMLLSAGMGQAATDFVLGRWPRPAWDGASPGRFEDRDPDRAPFEGGR